MRTLRRPILIASTILAAALTTGLATQDLGRVEPPALTSDVSARSTTSVVGPEGGVGTATSTTVPRPSTTTTFDLRRLAPIVERAIEYAVRVTPTTVAPVPAVPPRQHRPPAHSPSGGRCVYADLIRQVWHEDAERAIKIAWRESRCTATARNPRRCNPDGSHALSIFQLCMPLHAAMYRAVGCDPSQWFEPSCAVRAAHELFTRAGWGPWRL